MKRHQATPAWEDVALDVLEPLGRPIAPVDPVLVALSMGLSITTTDQASGGVVDGLLIVPMSELQPGTFQVAIARRIARYVLGKICADCSAETVEVVANALIHPPYERRVAAAKILRLPLQRLRPVS